MSRSRYEGDQPIPDVLHVPYSFLDGDDLLPPEAIEGLDYLHTYERFLLTPEGPVRRSRLEVDQCHRDWLLRWPASLSR